jgi:hypothetical protein
MSEVDNFHKAVQLAFTPKAIAKVIICLEREKTSDVVKFRDFLIGACGGEINYQRIRGDAYGSENDD